MASIVSSLVRNAAGDAFQGYHSQSRLAQAHDLSVEDVRNGNIHEFDRMLRMNMVSPADDVCLVFDCAGGAVQERILIAYAMYVFGLANVRVILCDVMYVHESNRPRVDDLPVEVEILTSRVDLLSAIRKAKDDGYQVILNALFLQSAYSGATAEQLYWQRTREQDAERDMFPLVARYGMFFTVVEYDSADQRVYICDFDLVRGAYKVNW